MPTLSGGINLALSAVLAHTQAMEIIEHNVANANTPGYRRQSAMLSSFTSSGTVPIEHYYIGQMGSGVTVDRIDRFNQLYFDSRYRAVSADAAQWAAQRDILSQLEVSLNETSENGLLPKLDQFWTGWSNLAADPSSTALRQQVLDYSGDLADAFRRRSTQMMQLQVDQDLSIKDASNQINQLASSIAQLNGEISHVLSVGDQPNDLMDKRDVMLDQLSKLTGSVSSIQSNGEVMVSINGHTLVAGHDYFQVTAQQDPANSNFYRILYNVDNVVLSPASGSLKGMFQARDTVIAGKLDGLNTLATTLMSQINTVHQAGFDLNGVAGQAFFTGTSAGSMFVNSALLPENLAAASAAGEQANSENASAISALRLLKIPALNGTMGDFYNGEITTLGIVLQDATSNATQQSLVEKALGNQRESLAGVSLDEEAANLIKFQRAYQAATRVMNAYDEMLDKVINGMGLVGR